MGLIKAGMGALGGTLADQWKEFFYCDSLDKDVLMVKGQKRTSRRSSNNGEDNIITNGSGIAVADGQCMLIVEQGRVVEVCAEPGEFTFDASTEPSVFTGNFGDSLAETFQTVAKRFTYGGDTGKDQRVYYINTKELGEILYGTATPIPFRVVVSEERGYKLSVNLRCNGSFTCRICDPLLFYTNVCSNVSTQYDASEIAPRLKSELMNALQPALGIDIMLIGSGSIRAEKLGPIVTYGDLIEGFPYDDGVFMFKVTGQQLRQMLHYMLREEAYTGHTEFYQLPSTLRLRYDRAKGDFDYFTYCGKEVGKEISDDALFTVGLQNYHFKNIESFFNISYDTICKLQKPRSVATSCVRIS